MGGRLGRGSPAHKFESLGRPATGSERIFLGVSTFCPGLRAHASELKPPMMLIQRRLVRPSHRFRQVGVLASALHAPRTEVRTITDFPANCGGRSRINFPCKQKDQAPAFIAAYNPV